MPALQAQRHNAIPKNKDSEMTKSDKINRTKSLIMEKVYIKDGMKLNGLIFVI